MAKRTKAGRRSNEYDRKIAGDFAEDVLAAIYSDSFEKKPLIDRYDDIYALLHEAIDLMDRLSLNGTFQEIDDGYTEIINMRREYGALRLNGTGFQESINELADRFNTSASTVVRRLKEKHRRDWLREGMEELIKELSKRDTD